MGSIFLFFYNIRFFAKSVYPVIIFSGLIFYFKFILRDFFRLSDLASIKLFNYIESDKVFIIYKYGDFRSAFYIDSLFFKYCYNRK